MATVPPPLRTAISDAYPNPSNATMRTGMGAFWDYVTNLLGTAGTPAAARTALGAFSHGQCVLSLVAGNLKLLPRSGNLLVINGVPCTVPDAGVTLPAAGLLATTLYYIYAVATAGVITSLEASTTGHSTDTTAGNKGVEIKTGDSTRSLVGMAYVKTAATFADTAAQRLIASWFNKKSIAGANPYTSSVTVTPATYAELSNANRLEFVSWAGDVVDLRFTGSLLGNSAASYVFASFGIDSTTVAEDVQCTLNNQPNGTGTSPSPQFVKSGLAEGYHFATLLVNNAGSGNGVVATGSATPGARCVISGIYQG